MRQGTILSAVSASVITRVRLSQNGFSERCFTIGQPPDVERFYLPLGSQKHLMLSQSG